MMTDEQWQAFEARSPAGTLVMGCTRVSIPVSFMKRGWFCIRRKKGILLRHTVDLWDDCPHPHYAYGGLVQFFETPQVFHARPRDLLYRLGKGRKKWLTFDQVMALPAVRE